MFNYFQLYTEEESYQSRDSSTKIAMKYTILSHNKWFTLHIKTITDLNTLHL